MSVRAERFPTTTRSISSSTASQWAVVVPIGIAAGIVIVDSYLSHVPSYLFQSLQNSFQCSAAGARLMLTGARNVVRINPFPKFVTKEHPAGSDECRGVFGLPLAGGCFEPPRQHRAQMPVPVRPGRIRPADRRLGGGKPAAQRIPQVV